MENGQQGNMYRNVWCTASTTFMQTNPVQQEYAGDHFILTGINQIMERHIVYG